MTKRLFVGGLSWGTSEEDLKGAFEVYGEVIDAKIITDRDTGRSRGFGFVTFAKSAEADTAIEQLDGSRIDGRIIRIDEAEDRRGGDRRYSDDDFGDGGGELGSW